MSSSGTAGTAEEAIRYGWNYARLLAEVLERRADEADDDFRDARRKLQAEIDEKLDMIEQSLQGTQDTEHLFAIRWRSILGMAGFVALLHVVGWGVLAFVVEPQNLQITSDGHKQLFGIGLGLTAYTLGMRHAFDADHIAAIDNTTRKLLTDRRENKPVSVGFWFSLGHSSVVFTMCLLLALGIKAIAGPVIDHAAPG